MDIEELRKKKKDTEDSIAHLLSVLQYETGCRITGIALTQIEGMVKSDFVELKLNWHEKIHSTIG